jgi:hypothetical protein
MTIQGMNANNGIFINGTLCGTGGTPNNPVEITNLTMSSLGSNTWNGFRFSNASLTVKFNGGSISNCFITGELGELDMYNSLQLAGSKVLLNRSNINVNNCLFINTNINACNYNLANVTASITNSTFTNTPDYAVINIDHYPNFNLYNDVLNYSSGTGIYISYSGSGSISHEIQNSTIHKTGSPEDISWGIQIYNSQADIINNSISNNRYGIALMNQSLVQVKGNSSAQSSNETQRIVDNYIYQVLSYDNSFPTYLHYNVIHNSLNNTPPLIYDCYGDYIYPDGYNSLRNIKCNCFPPNPLFSPPNSYDWSPTWCPPGTCSYYLAGEDQYLEAVSQMSTGNYTQAEEDYKQVIQGYPKTEFALASAKQLFILTGQDTGSYMDLKTYYWKIRTY